MVQLWEALVAGFYIILKKTKIRFKSKVLSLKISDVDFIKNKKIK